MATQPHRPLSNREQITACNHVVARRIGVPLKLYKSIKAVTVLAAVATGFYAIQEGADPMTTFVLVAFVVGGPEALETYLATHDTTSNDED